MPPRLGVTFLLGTATDTPQKNTLLKFSATYRFFSFNQEKRGVILIFEQFFFIFRQDLEGTINGNRLFFGRGPVKIGGFGFF